MPKAVVPLVVVAAFGFAGGACSTDRLASVVTSLRMLDGKEWTMENLQVDAVSSYCYEDAERNCRRYGRLYTWESAQRACASLGLGWRLPSDREWRELATHYGGVGEDSADDGQAAYRALSNGGSSGFNAQLGGDRENGRFDRVEAHGFYWTASETNSGSAPFYNFGLGGQALNRQEEGDKQMAASVRCVRE